MSYISLDVDVDDILNGMSGRELQDLAEALYSDGYVPKKVIDSLKRSNFSIGQQLYQDAIDKLANNYHQLSSEEESIIMNIAKRF